MLLLPLPWLTLWWSSRTSFSNEEEIRRGNIHYISIFSLIFTLLTCMVETYSMQVILESIYDTIHYKLLLSSWMHDWLLRSFLYPPCMNLFPFELCSEMWLGVKRKLALGSLFYLPWLWINWLGSLPVLWTRCVEVDLNHSTINMAIPCGTCMT
jgi:hypothetical protein